MSKNSGLQFLRPYLYRDLPVRRNSVSVYIRFFHSTRCAAEVGRTEKRKKPIKDDFCPTGNLVDELKGPIQAATPLPHWAGKLSSKHHEAQVEFGGRGPLEQRLEELRAADALVYPRIQRSSNEVSCAEFSRRYAGLKAGQKLPEEIVTVRGRVYSIRIAGKSLVFLDIVNDGLRLQTILNFANLESLSGVIRKSFHDISHLIKRGDIISVSGYPYVSNSGELSVNAVELPILLTPSLPPLPYRLEDRETRIRNRHVDLLVNKTAADTLRIRSRIIQYIRNFLLKDDFLEVQTPILAGKAGGAIARPFTTTATEFPDKQLALRIAPEIWLKRLVLGGMNRVFEIGSAFRNEGLDATHNPEYTTCEFYKSFADLEDLISMTEELISGLAEHVKSIREFSLKALPELNDNLFTTPFKRIQFVPAIEAALGESLPDLVADDATENLLALFTRHNMPVPLTLTLPRLLDKLASILIEPQCNEPTFIMHHPACMAPLSKSFLDPKTDQVLSARVELFIHQKEIANMYEEENSPFEQRKKFLEQAQWKDDENTAGVDQSYLEALEWGLPPTGGWGCGVDRLVMLFSGASRISDVLSFGSLRNVVNLGGQVASDEDEKHGVMKIGQTAPV